MKNTARIQKKHSAPPTTRQGKNSGDGPVTVVFSSSKDGGELARVDFDKRKFSAVAAGAKKLGLSLDEFFAAAVQCAIGTIESEYPVAPRGAA